MKRLQLLSAIGVLSLAMAGSSSLAAITEEQVAKLGGDEYTPQGAQRKGNTDGSIPEWTGGLRTPPSDWQEGMKLTNPWPDEKPLFTITADNYEKYQDKLSPGQIAMLKRYRDSFSMPVYPTHRSASHPQSVYDEVKKNATRSKLVGNGNGLNKYTSNTPFPFPEIGLEVIWNHTTRFRGYGSMKRTYSQIPVQTNGAFSPVLIEEKASWGRDMYGEDTTISVFFLQKIMAPPRLEGEVLLIHETLNQLIEPRQAWIFNAGQRRVRRAPNIAYDGPGTAADGLRTSDDLDLFNGSPDRYNWELKGKQELYIPYNAYKLASPEHEYKDIIKPGHMNPDLLRYELHRVWVVDATLKPNSRHIYARRTFYVDEDTWQISIVDHYDGRGELWKLKEGHSILHYQKQIPWLAAEALHDLISGRYLVIGLENEEKGYQYIWDYPAELSDYTPAALRRASRR